MTITNVVEIETPKKVLLNGLWFGSKKPKRVVIWVHGLGSSAFSKLGIIENLIDRKTAALTFNNRGHDTVSRTRSAKGKGTYGGAAFERFEDCVDDIQGTVNFARKSGAKEIYVAGHSTGCQKAAYWAYKKGKGAKGIILLAPISDYASVIMKYGLPKIRYMQAQAKAMLKSGRENEFVRAKFWDDAPATPHRFLSLYTPDSVEQSIFSYFEPARRAKVLSALRLPMLVILGEKDEYGDRPAQEIVQWFESHSHATLKSLIAKEAGHSFSGHEVPIARAIKSWIVNKQ